MPQLQFIDEWWLLQLKLWRSFAVAVHFLAKGLLPGRVLQRFDEQIFDKDWVTVLKTVEVPQLQFIVGLGMHQIETVQKTVEFRSCRLVWVRPVLDKVVDVPFIAVR